jgi:hypothetical protein
VPRDSLEAHHCRRGMPPVGAHAPPVLEPTPHLPSSAESSERDLVESQYPVRLIRAVGPHLHEPHLPPVRVQRGLHGGGGLLRRVGDGRAAVVTELPEDHDGLSPVVCFVRSGVYDVMHAFGGLLGRRYRWVGDPSYGRPHTDGWVAF